MENNINEFVKSLVRPNQTKYNENELKEKFEETILEYGAYSIETVSIVNSFNQKINGTLFKSETNNEKNPCIIYCHGNTQNQMFVQSLLSSALPKDISIFTFDFPGCGNSDESIITLGYKEPITINEISKFLQEEKGFKSIILWGFSMGAHCVLSTASIPNNNIVAVIADSPYISLKQICQIYGNWKSFHNSFEEFFNYINQKILNDYNFNISEIDLNLKIDNIKCPVFLFSGTLDSPNKNINEIFDKLLIENKIYLENPKIGRDSFRGHIYDLMFDFLNKNSLI